MRFIMSDKTLNRIVYLDSVLLKKAMVVINEVVMQQSYCIDNIKHLKNINDITNDDLDNLVKIKIVESYDSDNIYLEEDVIEVMNKNKDYVAKHRSKNKVKKEVINIKEIIENNKSDSSFNIDSLLVDYNKIVDCFNNICARKRIKRIEYKLNSESRRKVDEFYNYNKQFSEVEYDIYKFYEEYFYLISSYNNLMEGWEGKNGELFVPSFFWLIKNETFKGVVNGKYK